ncbi:hypothetical protein HLB23_07285 [Nocardia uniformis]|uniref:Uncharacterized protein n=2 Tax=Nocardia uniformis TaxID=53432 RepID=A0A849BZK1_9NOCA|nr:hypothetical protein [Nocardia uniformis]
MTVAVVGAAILAVGAGPLTAATATATPGIVLTAPSNPNYPMGTDPGPSGEPNYPMGTDPGPSGEPKKDRNVEKAEGLGGGLATKIIDTVAGVTKCGLSFALPSVKCSV